MNIGQSFSVEQSQDQHGRKREQMSRQIPVPPQRPKYSQVFEGFTEVIFSHHFENSETEIKNLEQLEAIKKGEVIESNTALTIAIMTLEQLIEEAVKMGEAIQKNEALTIAIMAVKKKEVIYQNEQTFIENVCKNIPASEIIQKTYLRPFEIILKTSKFDRVGEDGRRARHSKLPQGLMIACKDSILNNTFQPMHLNKFDINGRIINDNKYIPSDRFERHQHNFINLLKQVNKSENQYELEVAICICIYSQNRKMLNDTLQGVKQNIVNLVKSGVNQDKIAVFIIFDGIEKMDRSIFPLFQQYEALEKQDINQKVIFKTIAQNYKEYTSLQSANTQDTERAHQIQNIFSQKLISRVMYNEDELFDRKQRSFQNVYKNYMEMVELRQNIQKLQKNNKITYELLPDRVQRQFFMKLAREDKESQADGDEYLKKLYKNISEKDIYMEYVIVNQQKSLEICLKALNEARQYCTKYIEARNHLAYLSMFQLPIKLKSSLFRQQLDKLPQEYRQLIRQQNSDDLTNNRIILVNDQQEEQEEQQDEFIKMNLFMCIKYQNQGKLSSHNWFFNGFCKQLKPSYVILLDVGLKPKSTAIQNMYNQMKINPDLGGVCGYMSLKLQSQSREDQIDDDDIDFISSFVTNFVDIQRAQQVEYHFAHLLDKPFQSFFNFIHVLPGAFSGYNMEAIFHDNGEQLLRKYFSSLQTKLSRQPIKKTDLSFKWWVCKIFLPEFINSFFIKTDPDSQQQLLCNENMNLAEDRILCMGIYKSGYTLAYLPDAYSEVDPIKNLHSMFGQRKRWINGSFFAFEKVKEEFAQYQSNKCQFLLYFQMLYLSLVNSVSYFSVSLFFFTVDISMRAFYSDVLQPLFKQTIVKSQYFSMIPFFINFIDFIYAMVILSLIYLSLNLNYNDKKFKRMIYGTATVIGIFSIVVFIVLVSDLIRGLTSDGVTFIQINQIVLEQGFNYELLTYILRIIIIGVFLLHAIPIIVHGLIYKKFQILSEVVFGVISFLFYNPTYLITLNIYAICRVDDISWGTKGRYQEKGGIKKEIKEKWKYIKYMYVFKFIFWNTALSTFLLHIENNYLVRIVVTMGIMGVVVFLLIFKAILGMIYLIKYKLINKKLPKSSLLDINYQLISSEEIQAQIKQYKRRFDSSILTKTIEIRRKVSQQIHNNIKSIITYKDVI